LALRQQIVEAELAQHAECGRDWLGIDQPLRHAATGTRRAGHEHGNALLQLVGQPEIEFVEAGEDRRLAVLSVAFPLAAARASAFGSATAAASPPDAAEIDAFGARSAAGVACDGPRRRESQSLTHCGGVPEAKAALPSAGIHMRARLCLQGNLRLGHVHL
jgi:hypothetical protein